MNYHVEDKGSEFVASITIHVTLRHALKVTKSEKWRAIEATPRVVQKIKCGWRIVRAQYVLA